MTRGLPHHINRLGYNSMHITIFQHHDKYIEENIPAVIPINFKQKTK